MTSLRAAPTSHARAPMRLRVSSVVIGIAMVAAACSGGDNEQASPSTPEPAATAVPTPEVFDVDVVAGTAREFPPAPQVPDGPLHPDDQAALEAILGNQAVGYAAQISQLETQGDARVLWVLADLLRFSQGAPDGEAILATAATISGAEFNPDRPWRDLSEHLLAWDLPAPPDYLVYKAAIYFFADPRWQFVFADPDATIDYRLLTWGGVLVDDRELGDPENCARRCIPALDDPALVSGSAGDWYPDDRVVFALEVGNEAVAFPRNIMETHELVNITIGGRRLGIPYCTLCGSAQAFFTDEVSGVDRPPVLRSSGFLSRSNKVMYDLDSLTVFDTFTGEAVAGPLRAAGVVLSQTSVLTTTWGDWRETHPDTSIVAEDGGIGRTYEDDPLNGRDDNGPIFPIGQVDERLAVQEPVLGVALDAGVFLAFPVEAARNTLRNGDPVELDGVVVELDGLGLRATLDGERIATHQAFWFAWSQFHPSTDVWLPN